MPIFKNRQEAGQSLARILKNRPLINPLVIGIPRGGVVVGYEIAKELSAKLKLIIPKKLGLPHNPEVAFGAVAPDGSKYLNEGLVKIFGLSQGVIDRLAEEALLEIKRRISEYQVADEAKEKLSDQTVILVDDGIATGYTIFAAIEALRKEKPLKIIVAVPVSAKETVAKLSGRVDEVIVLSIPEEFHAVSQFYEDFSDVSDQEVKSLLGIN